MNKLKTIDPLTDSRWDDFITRHSEGTIFHHSAWTRVLRDRYGDAYSYYILENENGEISAAIPFFHIKSPLTGRRLVCLPSSDYCFPLAYGEKDCQELLTDAIQEVNQHRTSYLEIRGWSNQGIPHDSCLSSNPYYLVHVANLSGDLKTIIAQMTRNGRYNLRYAEKTPVNVRLGQDEKDLKALFSLATATRRRLNLLPQPYSFFQSIYRHIIIPGYGFILLAELNGKIIAANIYLCFKDTALCEFSVQDKSYFEYRPNYLITWKAIERLHDESFRYYHFGVTQPENLNLANFKRHWGSKEQTFPYYYYPSVMGIKSVHQSSPLYRTYATINRCLPGFACRLIGKMVYRHMG